MKPRETALSKTEISRRVGGRSLELVLYIRRRDTGKIKLREWEESLRVDLLLFGACDECTTGWADNYRESETRL